MSAQIDIDWTAAAVQPRREFDRKITPLLGSLSSTALRLTRDQDLADDLVQDTLVRAYRFWETLRPNTNAKAWVFTILRNTFINGYHKRGRARSFQSAIESGVNSHGSTHAVAGTTEPPGPAEGLAAQDTRSRIMSALAKIPHDYRVAVTLADLEGFAYKEIAEVMACPVGTVMSRIYRGRKMLHDLLLDVGQDLGYVTEVAA